MTKDVDLYWFSGTGNTLFIARETAAILEELGHRCRLKPMEKADPGSVDGTTTIGLVVPVAAQGTYPPVWEFVERLPERQGTELFLIDTLAIYSGGILGPMKKIAKRKGYRPIGAVELRMPNTFRKKRVDPARETKIVERARTKLRSFCRRLDEGGASWRDVPLYSDLMSSFYRSMEAAAKWKRLFPKRRSSACVDCGLCSALCPQGCVKAGQASIDLDSESCILCQRCLEFCPVGALRIGEPAYVKNGRMSVGEFRSALDV